MVPKRLLISLIFCFALNTIYSKTAQSQIVIPFDLINKLVVIKAFVNGISGHFIIDTGSGPLILNNQHFSDGQNKKKVLLNFKAKRSVVHDLAIHFSWNGKTKMKCNAIATDLESIEQIMKIKLLGYIGNDLLKDYELVFDYENKEVTLFKLDEKGKRQVQSSLHKNATDTLLLKKNNHLLYLSGKLGSKKLKLALDSGTSINLVHCGLLKKISTHFNPGNPIQIAGIDGKPVQTLAGKLNYLQLPGLILPSLRTCFTDINALNQNLPIELDGILGYDFFKLYKVAINYKKKELYVWDPEKVRKGVIAEK